MAHPATIDARQRTTRFWLIRHALVEENARARLYGVMDVELCPHTLIAQAPMYKALARRLPRPALWFTSPLSRTKRTADAIVNHGYPAPERTVVPDLIEQNLGEWQGLPHADLPSRLTAPAHPFWPIAGDERPPGGESFAEVIARVGPAIEGLAEAHPGEDIVAVSHGGTIRAAIAHAIGGAASQALHFSIENLSLTRLDRLASGWRVVCVNELPGY